MKSLGKMILLLLMCALFTFVGFFILDLSEKEKNKTKDYINVVGFVVDYKEDYEPNNNSNDNYDDKYSYFDEDYVYAPIVEYEVNGKFYLVSSDKYVRKPPLIGMPIEVSYDPNNPSEAIVDKHQTRIGNIIIGGLFIAIGPGMLIFVIVYSIKERRKETCLMPRKRQIR